MTILPIGRTSGVRTVTSNLKKTRNMRVIFLSFTLLIILKTELFGCCGSHMVSVFPSTPAISSNSIFLVDFSENDFKFKTKNKIASFEFIAVGNSGQNYPLKIIVLNYSGTHGQVLLKADENFQISDSISISAKYKETLSADSNEINSFIAQLSWRKWKVVRKEDKSKPILLAKEVKKSVIDHRGSSAPGFGIKFNMKASDNSFKELTVKQYDDLVSPMLFEISFEGQKLIVNSHQFNFSIYSGMCGRNFDFTLDKDYVATVRAIDASGNYSKEQKINFMIKLPKNGYR